MEHPAAAPDPEPETVHTKATITASSATLSAAQVAAVAAEAARAAVAQGQVPCAVCAALVCPGWEAMPAGFDDRGLRVLGSLRDGEDEPTLDEYHPDGTRLWSTDAPIALGFHPYNRCSVEACTGCGRAFLRYTEYGGYYMEQRVRELDPRLLVAPVESQPG